MSRYGTFESDPSAEGEIYQLLEQFRTGWERLDADAILSTMARKDDIVMYGTDLAERWIGYDAIADSTRAMIAAFGPPTYRWGAGEPFIRARGDTGWACGDLTVDMAADGENVRIVMRSSFVVVREGGRWQIAHAHFSIGQGEAVIPYDGG